MTGNYITLIFALILLGLFVALSPTLYVTEIAVLKKSDRPIVHLVALLAGFIASIALFVIITMFFVDPEASYQIPATSEIIKNIPLIDIIIGVLLIAGSYQLAKTKKETTEKADTARHHKILNSKTLFMFGFIRGSTRLSSLAAVIICVRYLKTYYEDNPWTNLLALVWLVLVSIAPFIFIAFGQKFSPNNYRRVMRLTGRVEVFNWKLILNTLMIVFGLFFIFIGIMYL